MNSRAEIVDMAYDIASEYNAQDLRLTLRQLYYQLVARGLAENGQKSYHRIGTALTQARLDGRFPIDWIEDRTRSVGETDTTRLDNVDDALAKSSARIQNHPYWLLRYGRWYGQPEKIFVWIEKEALAGVLEDTCKLLHVGLFPCKGYPSVSAVSSWVTSTYDAVTQDTTTNTVTILYLGDHDPDGLQIPRSANDLIGKVQDVKRQWFSYRIKRIALTLHQIREYDPPPFPAKQTSTRYRRYVDETGTTDAWELDALDPSTLRRLVTESVDNRFDSTIRARFRDVQAELRDEMRERMACEDWMRATLGVL